MQNSINLIVTSLSDQGLRVVRSVTGTPTAMLHRVYSRYDSRSTASKISNMSDMINTRYSSHQDYISAHCDNMAGLIEQIRSMGTAFYDSLAIGILVYSIEVAELFPVIASINTLSDDKHNWEDVTKLLIEDTNSIVSNKNHAFRASSSVMKF